MNDPTYGSHDTDPPDPPTRREPDEESRSPWTPWPETPAPPDEPSLAAAPDAEAAEETMAPAPPPAAPPEPRPSAGIKALLVAVGILMLAVLAMGGIALKLWSDRTDAQRALMAAVGAVSATASPEMAGVVGGRLERVRDAVDRGQFVEAATRLQHLTQGTGAFPLGEPDMDVGVPGFPGMGPPGEGAAPRPELEGARAPAQAGEGGLPPEAIAFFQGNERLGRLFAQANVAGRELREHGGDVTELRKIRDRIVEAARLGDTERVVELLENFEEEFDAQARKVGGGPPEQARRPQRARRPAAPAGPPRELIATAREISTALDKARAEGRDLRRAMDLLRQADQAGGAGDFARATRLSREALQAIRNAPKMPPRPELFENPLVAMLIDLLQVEDRELGETLAAMRASYEDAKNRTVERLGRSMREAIDALAQVGQRRKEVGRQLQEVRGPGPTPVQRRDMEALMRARVVEVRGEIGDLLGRVQAMTPEEFAANRERVVDDLLRAVFPEQRAPGERAVAQAPREAPPPGPSQERPVSEATRPTELSQQDRVRAKLLRAAEPYLLMRAEAGDSELVAELDEVFSRARTALAAGRFAEAEALTDSGLALLGIEPEPPLGAAPGGTAPMN